MVYNTRRILLKQIALLCSRIRGLVIYLSCIIFVLILSCMVDLKKIKRDIEQTNYDYTNYDHTLRLHVYQYMYVNLIHAVLTMNN